MVGEGFTQREYLDSMRVGVLKVEGWWGRGSHREMFGQYEDNIQKV